MSFKKNWQKISIEYQLYLPVDELSRQFSLGKQFKRILDCRVWMS